MNKDERVASSSSSSSSSSDDDEIDEIKGTSSDDTEVDVVQSAQSRGPRSPTTEPPNDKGKKRRKNSSIPSPVKGCTQNHDGSLRFHPPRTGNYAVLQDYDVIGKPIVHTQYSALARKKGMTNEAQNLAKSRLLPAYEAFDEKSCIRIALDGPDMICRWPDPWHNSAWQMFGPTSGNNFMFPSIMLWRSADEGEVCTFGTHLLRQIASKSFTVLFIISVIIYSLELS